MVRGLAGGQQDTLQRLKTLIDLAERDLDGIQAFLEADMVGAEIANVTHEPEPIMLLEARTALPGGRASSSPGP